MFWAVPALLERCKLSEAKEISEQCVCKIYGQGCISLDSIIQGHKVEVRIVIERVFAASGRDWIFFKVVLGI